MGTSAFRVHIPEILESEDDRIERHRSDHGCRLKKSTGRSNVAIAHEPGKPYLNGQSVTSRLCTQPLHTYVVPLLCSTYAVVQQLEFDIRISCTRSVAEENKVVGACRGRHHVHSRGREDQTPVRSRGRNPNVVP